jgi:hypothetical protein
MTNTRSSSPPKGHIPGWAQLRVWQLALLVFFAAIAIADLKTQRINEPALLALAAGGLLAYGLIGWIAWWAARRLEARLGPILLFLLYAVAMAALFISATLIYLAIAHVCRGCKLW